MRALLPAACLTVLSAGAAAASGLTLYERVTGAEQTYAVASGDTVWSITGRFTMSARHFAALNVLDDPDRLRPGMAVRVSDRHIVPTRRSDGLVIDLSSRTLYWFERGALKARYPVAVGRGDWATPPGRYRIVGRREDPEWRVPASIQREMRSRGEPVVPVVAPGPDNPLGRHYIQLSVPGYGLHGTNSPASIGKYATHGCLRLLPAHVARLYREARDGTVVEVIHEPVKVARDDAGRVYLEVHRVVYRDAPGTTDDVHGALAAAGVGPDVDWTRVDDVVARAWGVAEDVTAGAAPTDAELGAPATAQ